MFGTKIKTYSFVGHIPKELAVEVVTSVASVCYKSEEKSVGSLSLYEKLRTESLALPSTSFEFVPVNMDADEVRALTVHALSRMETPNILKYGYLGRHNCWVTNLRALLTDMKKGLIQMSAEGPKSFDSIMSRPLVSCMPLFKVEEMTMYTFGQLVRHREASLQVMSRRYVSAEKKKFTVLMRKDVRANPDVATAVRSCLTAYDTLRSQKVHPSIARGVIPQCATTEFWWMLTSPNGRDNFVELRSKKAAQDEIRAFAQALGRLLLEL